MIDNYEHYITKNIKAFYKRRLFSPIVYIILLTVLWFAFSLGDILSPIHIDDSVSFEAAYKDSDRYVKTTLQKALLYRLHHEGRQRYQGLLLLLHA